jgi:Glycosyl transferases group 1
MLQAVAPSGARERPARDSRTLVFSQRNLHRASFHAPQYEFEDVLEQIDDVRLLAPGPTREMPARQAARRVLNGAKKRAGVERRSPPWNRPPMATTPVETQHDVFFAVFNDAYQLSYLHQLPGWRRSSRYAVCFLLEAWTNYVHRDADYYRLLRDFDAVYLFTPASAPALQALGAPAPRFLAAATDALQFAPRRGLDTRPLDVFSYGRTSPAVHGQLLDLARADEISYLYDSTSEGEVTDFPQHRLLQASMMKRASYFIAHRINDSSVRRARTGGEESLSTRYFEGAAGGAVMLGSRPPVEEFQANFDWEDAVIDMPWDCATVADVLHDLGRQPERLLHARTSAVGNSLLRHDWVYRWEQVLGDAGLRPLPGAAVRRHELSDLARAVAPGVAAAHAP